MQEFNRLLLEIKEIFRLIHIVCNMSRYTSEPFMINSLIVLFFNFINE